MVSNLLSVIGAAHIQVNEEYFIALLPWALLIVVKLVASGNKTAPSKILSLWPTFVTTYLCGWFSNDPQADAGE